MSLVRLGWMMTAGWSVRDFLHFTKTENDFVWILVIWLAHGNWPKLVTYFLNVVISYGFDVKIRAALTRRDSSSLNYFSAFSSHTTSPQCICPLDKATKVSLQRRHLRIYLQLRQLTIGKWWNLSWFSQQLQTSLHSEALRPEYHGETVTRYCVPDSRLCISSVISFCGLCNIKRLNPSRKVFFFLDNVAADRLLIH